MKHTPRRRFGSRPRETPHVVFPGFRSISNRRKPSDSDRDKAPAVKKNAWLPVGVNYNKPARGSVSLI